MNGNPWTDGRILDRVREHYKKVDHVHTAWYEIARDMRDEMQGRIDEMREKMNWMDIQLLLRDEKIEFLEAELVRTRAERDELAVNILAAAGLLRAEIERREKGEGGK